MLTKLWQTLRLKKLSDLNGINNFQDTTILCEIFESRAKEMMKKIPYNPQKCTSASFLSRCIHQYLFKTIIALPAQAEIVELFEKTLIGKFSCEKTRLAFDSSILLPKNLQYQQKENFKFIFKIKHEMENIFEDKRVVTKILKMDENNQYGNDMTKPLPTGNIKKAEKLPAMKEFDLILQRISDKDKIEHLFVVGIEFYQKNDREKQLFFNEIYTLIFLKKRFVRQ